MNNERIRGVAVGETGPALLHAAVFEPDVQSVILKEAPVSYASMESNRLYTRPTSCMVAGALTKYEASDEIAILKRPRRGLKKSLGPTCYEERSACE